MFNYDDLDNDIEELTRNLLDLNGKNIKKAEKTVQKLKPEKAEKRLKKTVSKLFKR